MNLIVFIATLTELGEQKFAHTEDVDKRVVVRLDHEPRVHAVVQHPLVAGEVFDGQVFVGVHEVRLYYVVVLL